MAECASEVLSASDVKSIVDALPEFLAETKCPNCKSSDASTHHRVEDIKNVRFCSKCETLFGIDDSMNLDDLRQLMEEGKARFKTASSCVCGNDDVDAFVFEDCQQSGKLLLKCMNCNIARELEISSAEVDVMSEDPESINLYDDSQVIPSDVPSVDQTFNDPIPHQSHKSFTCECGNDETELFELMFDVSGDNLVSVRCWNCGRKVILWKSRCIKCGEQSENLFGKPLNESGHIADIFCRKCEANSKLIKPTQLSKRIDASRACEVPLFISYKKTKVISLEPLQRGDHVAWKRFGGVYSHHGIVVSVLHETDELDVIHNTVAEEGKAVNGGFKCKILRRKEKVDLSKKDLYLCQYEPGDCLQPDEVIARAESLLDVKNYHLLANNCEHFATLCKTGRRFSAQVTSFLESLTRLNHVSAQFLQDEVIVAITSHMDIEHAIDTVAGGFATGVNLNPLSICGTVAITLAVEGVVFGVKTGRAYKEYKEGVINWEEFRAMTAEAGCSSAIRFVCTSVGGVIGQFTWMHNWRRSRAFSWEKSRQTLRRSSSEEAA